MLYQDELGSLDSGGETFIQRQKRLQGTQQRNVSQPAATAANGGYAGPSRNAQPRTQVPTAENGGITSPSSAPVSPVTGNGKIPDPPTPPPPAPPVPDDGRGRVNPDGSVEGPETEAPSVAVAAPQPQAQQIPWEQLLAALQAKPAASVAPVSVAMPDRFSPQQLPEMQRYSVSPLQRAVLGDTPFSTYSATTFNAKRPELGELPAAYAGSELTQFNAPDQRAITDPQQALLARILNNPETLNEAVTSQMKERVREQALAMASDLESRVRQNAASRGTTNGGQLGMREQAINMDAIDQILRSNRDIDIAAAQTNRQDQLGALSAAEALLSGQMGRASTTFQNTLTGQTAQAADRRTAAQDAISRAIAGFDAERVGSEFDLRQQMAQADEGFRSFQSQRSAEDAALDRVMKQFGVDQTVAQNELQRAGFNLQQDQLGQERIRDNNALGFQREGLDLQRELGLGGLRLDEQRLTEQRDQFGKGYGLDVLRFLEGQRQHNNNLGFNYNQLEQGGQQDVMRLVLSLLGG